MKRIIIFSDTYLPLLGGAEVYTHNFSSQLKKLGYNVVIFTNTKSHEEEPGVIRQIWPGWLRFRIVGFVFCVSKLIEESDLIFSNYTYRLSTIVGILCKIKRKPLFVFAHGLGTLIDKEHPFVHRVYRYISLKMANGAIATSTELAELAGKFNSNTLVATAVNFNTIDNELDQGEADKIQEKFHGKKIIVTVRRLVPKNGVQYLIQAMPYVLQEQEDIVCLLAGEGRMAPNLKDLAEKLSIKDKINFLGEVKNEKIFNLIRAADLVVFPSSAEAISLAAIEAMYIGTPVLASRVGGLIELIGNNEERGFLIDLFGRSDSIYTAPELDSIPENTYRSFAHKITSILGQKDLAESKTHRAKVFVKENYDWEHVSKNILNFTNKNTK